MPVSLSVLMPALNEAQNIGAAINGVIEALHIAGISDFEILVLTCLDRNGASDGTVEIVRRLAAADPRIRSVHVDGYQRLGEKFKNGVLLASKEYVVMIPGDNENDSTAFPELFRQVGKADMVVSYTANMEARPLHRRVISRIYTLALNMLFWHGMPYYNGINAYRAADLKTALPQTESFAYSAEILITLLRRKKSYVVVPVRVQPRGGKSKALRWDNFKSVVAAIVKLWSRLVLRRPAKEEART